MQTNEPGSLQNKFQDFGAAPSEQLWNSIASNLDEKKKRRVAFWWWFVGAAAFVTLLFGVYQLGYNNGAKENNSSLSATKNQYQLESTNNNQNELVVENETSSNQNLENQTEQNQNENLVSKNENESVFNSSDNNVDKSNYVKNVNNKNQDVEPNNIVETVVVPSDSKIYEASTNNDFLANYEAKKFPLSTISKIQQTISDSEFLYEPLVEIQNPTPKNQWEIGFNVGTLKGLHTSNQNLTQDANLSIATFDNLDASNSIEGTGLQSYSNLSESYVDILRPIQFEFTVERNIKKRGHFQTGLNLGLLFSNNSYTSGDISNVRSKFLSVGIPIHFNYDLIQRNRFSFYTGIGVNYEVPLFESVKTSYTYSAFETTKMSNFTKGYMISAQLNTGFRFQINQNLKLDFRPNLRYYIHQSMQSVYPALERKIWVGASLGLIWKI